MNKEELRKALIEYTKKNDFQLNTDSKHVDLVINGLLQNEKKTGLKLCPCRLGDGTHKRDLELICPCNFKIQQKWKEKGECWCGLFTRREESLD